MIYNPKKGGGVCKCGAKLPVPTWTRCMLCDGSKTVKTPFVELKPPLIIETYTKRSYEKLPQIILDKKKYKPLKYYMGYEIKIPFYELLNAKELMYDQDNWSIIGWR